MSINDRKTVKESIEYKKRELERSEAHYTRLIERREQLRSELSVIEIDTMQMGAYIRQLKAQTTALESHLEKLNGTF